METDLLDIVGPGPVVPELEIPGYSIAILVMTTAFTIGIIVVVRRKRK